MLGGFLLWWSCVASATGTSGTLDFALQTDSQWQTLEAPASQGNWSDLHAWLDALAHDTQCKPLVHAVRLALDPLDFERIRQIARTVTLRP